MLLVCLEETVRWGSLMSTLEKSFHILGCESGVDRVRDTATILDAFKRVESLVAFVTNSTNI